MTTPSLLIAGIGNIFLGDDAFGVEVARVLARRRLPEGVVVRDIGIRGIDLMYALMDEYDGAILIDAVRRGQPAGTVMLIEPDSELGASAVPSPLEAHTLDAVAVVRRLGASGARCRLLRLVGCDLGPEADQGQDPMQMSWQVRRAIEPAAQLVEEYAPAMLLMLENQSPERVHDAPHRKE